MRSKSWTCCHLILLWFALFCWRDRTHDASFSINAFHHRTPCLFLQSKHFLPSLLTMPRWEGRLVYHDVSSHRLKAQLQPSLLIGNLSKWFHLPLSSINQSNAQHNNRLHFVPHENNETLSTVVICSHNDSTVCMETNVTFQHGNETNSNDKGESHDTNEVPQSTIIKVMESLVSRILFPPLRRNLTSFNSSVATVPIANTSVCNETALTSVDMTSTINNSNSTTSEGMSSNNVNGSYSLNGTLTKSHSISKTTMTLLDMPQRVWSKAFGYVPIEEQLPNRNNSVGSIISNPLLLVNEFHNNTLSSDINAVWNNASSSNNQTGIHIMNTTKSEPYRVQSTTLNSTNVLGFIQTFVSNLLTRRNHNRTSDEAATDLINHNHIPIDILTSILLDKIDRTQLRNVPLPSTLVNSINKLSTKALVNDSVGAFIEHMADNPIVLGVMSWIAAKEQLIRSPLVVSSSNHSMGQRSTLSINDSNKSNGIQLGMAIAKLWISQTFSGSASNKIKATVTNDSYNSKSNESTIAMEHSINTETHGNETVHDSNVNMTTAIDGELRNMSTLPQSWTNYLQQYFPFSFDGRDKVVDESVDDIVEVSASSLQSNLTTDSRSNSTSNHSDETSEDFARYLWPFHEDPIKIISVANRKDTSNDQSPSHADLVLLARTQVFHAINAAKHITTIQDFEAWKTVVGGKEWKDLLRLALITAQKTNSHNMVDSIDNQYSRIDVLTAIMRILEVTSKPSNSKGTMMKRSNLPVDDNLLLSLLQDAAIIDILCDMLQGPLGNAVKGKVSRMSKTTKRSLSIPNFLKPWLPSSVTNAMERRSSTVISATLYRLEEQEVAMRFLYNAVRSMPSHAIDDTSIYDAYIRRGDEVVKELQRYPRLINLMTILAESNVDSSAKVSDRKGKIVRPVTRLLQSLSYRDNNQTIPISNNTNMELVVSGKWNDTNDRVNDIVNNTLTSTLSHSSLNTTPSLSFSQMVKVTTSGLGCNIWYPNKQRGLRILSLDGGGTRGVLTIALLKELFDYIFNNKYCNKRYEPFEVFDIICGTSTGGIIAVLLSLQQATIDETGWLYDNCIEKIFANKSNLKFVRNQAFYDESILERLLHDICKDDLLIDCFAHSHTIHDDSLQQLPIPKFFCISSQMHTSPPQIQLWRNYQYPPPSIDVDSSNHRRYYSGTYRIPTKTAIRATTAAPTFFTPINWQGGLYCDGALVANNPTAIALQEAKRLYPNVPIDCVVSLGTGWFIEEKSNMLKVGLDTLLNQLICSSTETEDVHNLLEDLLPIDQYFRLNPLMKSNVAIDEKSKLKLEELKAFAKESFNEVLNGPNRKRLEGVVKKLRGG